MCHAAAWCQPTATTQVASFTALSHAALLSESVLAAAFFEGTCGVFMRVVCSTGCAYYSALPPSLHLLQGGSSNSKAPATGRVSVPVFGNAHVISLVSRWSSHPACAVWRAGTPAEGQWCSAKLEVGTERVTQRAGVPNMSGREAWRCRMWCGANKRARLLLCRTHIVCMWGAGAAAISLAGGVLGGRTHLLLWLSQRHTHTQRGVRLLSCCICASCVVLCVCCASM